MYQNEKDPTIDGYKELVNSIVLTAIRDYDKYCIKLYRAKKNMDKKAIRTYEIQLERIEKFFNSEYYSSICSIPSSTIMRKLNEIKSKYGGFNGKRHNTPTRTSKHNVSRRRSKN